MEKRIITISRQFGSGGHEVGMRLAKRLGVKFYDKELVDLLAKDGKYDRGEHSYWLLERGWEEPRPEEKSK